MSSNDSAGAAASDSGGGVVNAAKKKKMYCIVCFSTLYKLPFFCRLMLHIVALGNS